ncbi:MAG: ABC transporter ATP-binding protein [Patescibacteria group bacterium]
MALIEVKDIYKIYQNEEVSVPALQKISFSIKEGEFVAIMGPSGSGKSTLLHILGFLDKPSKGIYLFEGKNVNDYSENEIARMRNEKIGFVFQSFNLLSRATVFENVKLPLFYSNKKESEWNNIAKREIKAVELSLRENHEPSQLSGGEKQRVAIARALVNNPPILFADEPTGNLDSKSGKMIMEIMEKLNRKDGRTVILITHDQNIADYANRIIKIRDGMIESDTSKNDAKKQF